MMVRETGHSHSPEALEFYRGQVDRIANSKRGRTSRLTIQDFEENGINVVKEMWAGLQRIENPTDYMKYFFEMLSFVAPKLNSIDIQHEVNSSGQTKIDLSGFQPSDLIELLRKEKE